jgi:hypothetical protein
MFKYCKSLQIDIYNCLTILVIIPNNVSGPVLFSCYEEKHKQNRRKQSNKNKTKQQKKKQTQKIKTKQQETNKNIHNKSTCML